MKALIAGVSGPVDVTVAVPGSKSVANRALVCAALVPAGGVSIVRGVPAGDDCVAMLRALEAAGAVRGELVTGGLFPGSATAFDAGIAGTTSRFLTAVAALSGTGVTVDGGEPLRRRPMADLHGALSALGAVVSPLGETGHLPVRVSRGSLHGGEVQVRGDVSSQFISALMMIGPLLDGGLCIRVDGPLVSRPYVEMTASVMRSFGAAVVVGDSRIDVRQKPYTPADYLVEPDFSSAAFAIMALAFRKGRVLIPGLALATMQGDSAVLGVAEAMGMKVQRVGNDIVVERDADRVLAVDVNLADASDLVPAVAVACCAAAGTSTITGVGFIRAKESDRLGDFAAEMSRFGCTVEVLADGLRIHGGEIGSSDSPMGVHHDHRLAMAFALLAGSGRDVLLEDAEVVSKSWPSYFGDMGALLGPVTALN